MAAGVPARWGLAALFGVAVPVVVLAAAAFLRLGWRAYRLPPVGQLQVEDESPWHKL